MRTSHSSQAAPRGRRAAGALCAAALLLAAAPPAASADELCVHQPGDACAPGETDMGADLTAAFDAADANGADGDTIRIGAGTFTGPYFAGLVQHEIITIKGAGPGTVLTSANDPGRAVLDTGSADVRISDLSIALPGEPTMIGVLASGRIERVSVSGPDGAGFRPNADATIQDSSASIADGHGISVRDQSADVVIRRVDLHAEYGLVTSAPNTVVRQSQVTADALGVTVMNGGTLRVDDTAVRAPDGTGVWAACQPTGGHAVLRHVTIDAYTAVSAGCGSASATSSSVAIDSSIVRGSAADLCTPNSGLGTSSIESQYSWIGPKRCTGGPQGAYTSGTGDLATEPVLGAGQRLLAGSPAIDAGNPASVTGPLDATGAARSVDGDRDGTARPDMGAHEHVPPVPVWAGDPAPEPVEPAAAPLVEPSGSGEPPVGPVEPAEEPAGDDLAAALRRMLAAGHGRRYAFAFPGAGALTVTWTKGERALARGTATRTAAGTAKLRVRLTRAGRRVVAGRGHLPRKVRAAASFTPAGLAPVSVDRRVRTARG
jgi:hypothetical protein